MTYGKLQKGENIEVLRKYELGRATQRSATHHRKKRVG